MSLKNVGKKSSGVSISLILVIMFLSPQLFIVNIITMDQPSNSLESLKKFDQFRLSRVLNDNKQKPFHYLCINTLEMIDYHNHTVSTVAWSPDGKIIASGDDSGVIILWNASNQQSIRTIFGHGVRVESITWSPDGFLLVSTADEELKVWNSTSGENLQSFVNPSEDYLSAAWSPDGKVLAVGVRYVYTYLYNTTTWEIITNVLGPPPQGAVQSISWSPDGKLFTTAIGSEKIELYNGTTYSHLSTLWGHDSAVISVAWSPSDDLMLSCSQTDNTVRVWNITSEKELQIFTVQGPRYVAWSKDINVFCASTVTGIVVWNLTAGVTNINIPILDALTVAWNPVDFVLAAGTAASNVWILPLNDYDSDGMPNNWEDQMGLDSLDPLDAQQDADADGLTNQFEYQIGTSAKNSDTDSDGMSDRYENEFDLDPLTDDASKDKDQDGIPNLYEYQNGLHVGINDTSGDKDQDGMPNLFEYQNGLLAGTNDASADEDLDGIPNLYEYQNGLQVGVNDASADKDQDGLSNLYEYQNGLQVGINDTSGDKDQDGMPNLYEYQNGLLAGTDDASGDKDNDSIPNLYEYQNGLLAGTDDASEDKDNDGMPNLYEYKNGLRIGIDDASEDKDGDGLTNLQEFNLGTAANDPDTDNDNFNDKAERDLGLDPTNPLINPLTIILFSVVTIVVIAFCTAFLVKRHRYRTHLMKSYKAPDYSTAKQVELGNFPDYQTFQRAHELGAETLDQLLLIEHLQAPDYVTSQKIQAGNFPNYSTYKHANKAGAKNIEHLKLVQHYQAPDYVTALKLQIATYVDQIIENLTEDGKFIYANWTVHFPDVALPKSTVGASILEKGFRGIHTSDWEVFLTDDYIRTRLRSQTKVFADLDFKTAATHLEIPSSHVEEILIASVESGIISGRVDRINKQIYIREIPESLVEQMISGRLTSIDEITHFYKQPLDDSLNTLQSQLLSNQYVLSREKEIVRIEQISPSCQVCGTKSINTRFLKCEKCSRDLCWDHFEELGTVGRVLCPYCDGLLSFLPKYCEKCHIDYIRQSKGKDKCEFCGYPLKVKQHLEKSYKQYLIIQERLIKAKSPDGVSSKKKF